MHLQDLEQDTAFQVILMNMRKNMVMEEKKCMSMKMSTFTKKRRMFAEKKFFTEKDEYSDEASTSNQQEGRRTARSSRVEPHRFMSESEIGDAKSKVSLDTETKVNEEADDLYFAMLNKLKA